MPKYLLIIIVIIAVVAIIFVLNKQETSAPTLDQTISPSPSPTATPTPTPDLSGESSGGQASSTPVASESPISSVKSWTIEMINDSFVPAQLTIKVGDTVTFINKDIKKHWPASGVHPTHQICKGFDSLRGVEQNKEYSYTFTEAKECPMHDHSLPSMNGKITVTE